MLYYKPLTVKELLSFWKKVEGDNEVPVSARELLREDVPRRRKVFVGEMHYALIPIHEYSKYQRNEFEGFKAKLIESGFRVTNLSKATVSYARRMADHYVTVYQVTVVPNQEEYLIIDTNKLLLLERQFPESRFTNGRWYELDREQAREAREEKKKKRKYYEEN